MSAQHSFCVHYGCDYLIVALADGGAGGDGRGNKTAYSYTATAFVRLYEFE